MLIASQISSVIYMFYLKVFKYRGIINHKESVHIVRHTDQSKVDDDFKMAVHDLLTNLENHKTFPAKESRSEEINIQHYWVCPRPPPTDAADETALRNCSAREAAAEDSRALTGSSSLTTTLLLLLPFGARLPSGNLSAAAAAPFLATGRITAGGKTTAVPPSLPVLGSDITRAPTMPSGGRRR